MPYWGGWGPCCCSGTTIKGTVVGCNGIPVPNAIVTVVSYNTLIADVNGYFEGDPGIPSSSTYTLNVKPSASDPFKARFTSAGISYTVTLTIDIVNDLGNRSATTTVATGYRCTYWVYYPLPNSLHLTDSYVNTTRLMSLNNANNLNTGFPGCPAFSCSAVASPQALKTYQLVGGTSNRLNVSHGYALGNVNHCPAALSTQTYFESPMYLETVSVNPFQASYTLPSGNTSPWYCGHASIFTLTE